MESESQIRAEQKRLIILSIIFICSLFALFYSQLASPRYISDWVIWIFLLLTGAGMLVAVFRHENRRLRQLTRSHHLLEEYRRLVDKSAYVSKTDLLGVITYVNDRFCEVSGYTKEELIGAPHNIVRHPDMDAAVFKQMWETLESGHIWQGIIKNRSKTGQTYYVDSFISPIWDDVGAIEGYIALRYDVTKLEEALTVATEATEAKDRFLANMSHEIRTPLNAILGFVELLRDRVGDDESRRYLETIGRNGQMLLGIINDVLDFAKIESGKLELEKKPCDLKAEVANVVALFRANASAKGVTLQERWCEPFPACVVTDPLRVRQVLGNLLSNAIKFTPAGKQVTVRASHRGDRQTVEFAVVDEGIGIPAEWHSRIFEAFSQVRTSDATMHGGTGLGLPISLALARGLGGTLTLSSEMGKGTTFTLRLPAQLCNGHRAAPQNIAGAFDGNRRRILVAEDQADNQLLIRLFLEKMDFLVQIVPDGQEALERFCGEPYDLVLLDENMPNMNGTAALKAMREWEKRWSKPATPIAVLTANAVKGDRERFLAAGFDDYLSKPILKPELIKLLQRRLPG